MEIPAYNLVDAVMVRALPLGRDPGVYTEGAPPVVGSRTIDLDQRVRIFSRPGRLVAAFQTRRAPMGLEIQFSESQYSQRTQQHKHDEQQEAPLQLQQSDQQP
jgi:hypothetical protein